jgi:hypothetical protein
LRNWEKVQFRVFIYRSSQNWFLSHVSEPEVAASRPAGQTAQLTGLCVQFSSLPAGLCLLL